MAQELENRAMQVTPECAAHFWHKHCLARRMGDAVCIVRAETSLDMSGALNHERALFGIRCGAQVTVMDHALHVICV
jgi:hypothetical protein